MYKFCSFLQRLVKHGLDRIEERLSDSYQGHLHRLCTGELSSCSCSQPIVFAKGENRKMEREYEKIKQFQLKHGKGYTCRLEPIN